MPTGLHPKQVAFLLAPHREILFGGAAGGGKSEALLAGALQYADVPGYAAIIFRRTFRDLALPSALMARAEQWLAASDASWKSKDYTWRFPSGATLSFGYLEKEADKYRYQSSQFQFVAFDELTQFTESQYTYLFSRLRRLEGSEVPIRMRSASNPGGVGHEWVKARFIGRRDKPVVHPQRIFIPSRLEDNPSLDQTAYEAALAELDPITRAQLRWGDWEADGRGGVFERQWFKREFTRPRRFKWAVRFWDMASTEKKPGQEPDYTVGTLLALDEQNEFWVLDVQRFRKTPAGNEREIRRVAEWDGVGVDIWMEQEPGSSGKIAIDHYRRNVLFGYAFHGLRSTGDKATRAKLPSSAAQGDPESAGSGIYHVMVDGWNEPWFDELTNFPDVAHDDQVDSLSGGHAVLTNKLKSTRNKQAKQGFGYGHAGGRARARHHKTHRRSVA